VQRLLMDKASEFPVRVYYEDTDFSGNVYHASYLKFLERGRTEWLRALGIHHSELARDGLAFAVRNMEIGFEAAAGIDDELLVTTNVTNISGARIFLDQGILRNGQLITRAEVVIVVINEAGKAIRIPKELRDMFVDR